MGKARDCIYEQGFDDYGGTKDDENKYEEVVLREGIKKRTTHF